MLSFVKMQALGNDFVLFDHIEQPEPLPLNLRQHVADRRLGVGCDQLLVVKKSDHPNAQFAYDIFNADGSEVEQCGNGVRCIAKYLHDTGHIPLDEAVTLQCLAGLIQVTVYADDTVNVNMGLPQFEPASIELNKQEKARDYDVTLNNKDYRFGAVSLGNPHAVVLVESLDLTELAKAGQRLNQSGLFSQGVNVGFMQIHGRDHITLAVYERGVGMTQACGSGACAAVAVGRLWGLLDDSVRVDLPGGRLTIRWSGDERSPIFMQGAASTVFYGKIT